MICVSISAHLRYVYVYSWIVRDLSDNALGLTKTSARTMFVAADKKYLEMPILLLYIYPLTFQFSIKVEGNVQTLSSREF